MNQSKSGPRVLHSHRGCMTLLERARVRCDGTRIVYDVADDSLTKTFNLPYANLAVLLLGQGASLTSDAARLLSEEGTLVCFCGSGGTPITFASQIVYRPTDHLQRWMPVFLDDGARLKAAKALIGARARNIEAIASRVHRSINEESLERLCARLTREAQGADTVQQLLGFEGQFTKDLYALLARTHHLSGWRRERAGNEAANDACARVNSFLDHGNYLAYGLAATVIWCLGVPASLAALHGKTRAGGLVFDLADTIKDAFVLPFAFREGSKDRPDDNAFRASLIEAFDKHKALALCFKAFDEAVEAGEAQVPHA